MSYGAVPVSFKKQILLAFAVGIGIAVAAMLLDVGVDWMQTALAYVN